MGYIENCHKAPTFLEKGDEKKKFTSQSEVDQAWADGWYAPGRPESAETQESASEDGRGEQIPGKGDKDITSKSKKSKKKGK